MQLQTQFLTSKNEWLIFFGAVLMVALISLYIEYQSFLNFKSHPIITTKAKLLNQYTKTSKNGKEYAVLKFASDSGYKFYTTKYEELKDLRDRHFEVTIKTDKVEFLVYLKSFYAPSLRLKLLPLEGSYLELKEKIKSQHEDARVGELYSALYLATAVSKELRDVFVVYGLAHLVAISGFHAGVIWAFIFGALYYPYLFFQSRYFPYRNRFFDLSAVAIVIMLFFLYYIDFVPSFLRAVVMSILGVFFISRAVKILSFETLLVAGVLILAFFPRVFFDIGFWLSIAGVFNVFLFLSYFRNLSKIKMAVGLCAWVFFAMTPIVHFIFPQFSPYQLISIPLSLIFGVFYPVSAIAHIIGLGDIFDFLVLLFFENPSTPAALKTPFWFFVLYLLSSLGAIFSRYSFYILNILIFGFYFVGAFLYY